MRRSSLNASESSGEDAAASCNALGLFAVERRLVVVEQVERWKAADLKAVQEYSRKPAPTSVLALLGEEVKRDSALAKAVAKAGEVLIYDSRRRAAARPTCPNGSSSNFASAGS